ncbi:MAG: hypothetical protein EOM50_18865 [Erysipelotrichia bacterium]|nr:hypothetical protein [Erysipelotrichia bacterium]NCC55301.1 hypothetical protein [Erysipelotrichia bacterium]
MNRSFNKVWKETLIIALCFILLGCFMLMKPEMTLTFFSDIVGALILMLAILAFYRHYKSKRSVSFELAYGIVCMLGALLLFFNKTFLANLIPIVLGIIMIVNAVFKIPYIFDLKKIQAERWYLSLLLMILKIIVAIALIVNPFETMFKITQIIGISVIIFAICDVFDLVIIKYYLHKVIDQEGYVNVDAYHEVIEHVEVNEIEENE